MLKKMKKIEEIANSIYVFSTGVTFASIHSESVYVYYFCNYFLMFVCFLKER